jgi:ribosome biogenesis GTPase / thiamine phosphate phosphatase
LISPELSPSHALADLGFRPSFAEQLDRLERPDLVPARIAADGQNAWHLLGCRAPIGELSGRLRNELEGTARPAVGDWVAVADSEDRTIIHHVLDRRTAMIRRASGPALKSQVIAANVDVFGVVTSANHDLNVRRIERYLSVIWESGAVPVIVLNKVDLVNDVAPMLAEIESVAMAVPIVRVSARTGAGLEELRSYVGRGTTVALVGSSGVGKSSLINRLLGREAQQVNAIRDDDARGRHTTTRRELIVLPDGGVLVDTPGMRELGLVEDGGGVDTTFTDIAAIADTCRFADCQHESEPGCAVREALVLGTVAPERWESYRKLQREAAAFEARQDPVLAAERRREWKVITKAMRAQSKVTRKP